MSFNAALDQPVRGDICGPTDHMPPMGEHDCPTRLKYDIYGAYVHMPVFLVQLPKRHRKQPLLQEACRLGSAWQCALQLLQVTLVELSELEADVVSQLDFLSDL